MKIVDEEMDGVAREQRKRLKVIEDELEDVKKWLGRIWHAIETTDIELSDASDRIKEHRERKEKLESRRRGGAGNSVEAESDAGQDGDDHGLRSGHERVPEDQRANRVEGVHPVVRQGDRGQARQGHDSLLDPDAGG